jgi:hypothetical protein
MKRTLVRAVSALGAIALMLGLLAAVPGVAQASGPHVCSGTPSSPGTLSGTYWTDVVVKGACQVNAGRAVVHGNLTVSAGSALVAAFARNDVTGKGSSSLHVTKSIFVRTNAAMLLGCFATSFACLDDPNQNAPTLDSHSTVAGGIYGSYALGIIVHDVAVGGNVTQIGGGGGFTCTPKGIFAVFGSPVFTTYEDSTVGGNVSITDMRSCWLGTARVNVWGSAYYTNNQLNDPDAIEIVSNHVHGDLTCTKNSMVWDSGDLSQNLFPRQPQPNTVDGHRIGQCRLNSPTSPTDKPGPGPF